LRRHRFPDRDMFMRYRGGGVGHKSTNARAACCVDGLGVPSEADAGEAAGELDGFEGDQEDADVEAEGILSEGANDEGSKEQSSAAIHARESPAAEADENADIEFDAEQLGTDDEELLGVLSESEDESENEEPGSEEEAAEVDDDDDDAVWDTTSDRAVLNFTGHAPV